MATGTVDPARLQRVAEMLAEAAFAREAGQRRRLPVVQPVEVAGLVEILHDQLDHAIELRDSEAAATGVVIACSRGCNACCHLPVVMGEHEAVAIALWLRQPEHAEVKQRFLAKYPAWRDKLGDRIERIGEVGASLPVALAIDYFQQRAPCPFNDEAGLCTIYPVRPGVCRTAHALDSNERCQGMEGAVSTLEHPAVTNTVEAQKAMRAALHETQSPRGNSDLLPKAVMRQLAKATAFPNSPCPCGSGQKFKRCCGP